LVGIIEETEEEIKKHLK